jgi:predicted O-methyltransferase YrrM
MSVIVDERGDVEHPLGHRQQSLARLCSAGRCSIMVCGMLRSRVDVLGVRKKLQRAVAEGGPALVAARATGVLHRAALCRAGARKLRRELPDLESLEDAIDYAFGFGLDELTIRPAQARSEITELLDLAIRRGQLGAVLEIGTESGGTLFLLARAAEPDAIIATIDIGRPERAVLYRAFARDQQRVEMIHADSHDPSTPDRVRRLFGDQPLDLLFIDGDHSYEGVRRDFELYSPLVGKGGMVALHDIVPGPPVLVGEVPRFWRELQSTYATSQELVEDWQQGGLGIGVILL